MEPIWTLLMDIATDLQHLCLWEKKLLSLKTINDFELFIKAEKWKLSCFSWDRTAILHFWCNLTLIKIKETLLLEDLHLLKWISHTSRRENKDITKILTFHATSSKSLGRKAFVNTGKSNNSYWTLRKLFSWKILLRERIYKFQATVVLTGDWQCVTM